MARIKIGDLLAFRGEPVQGNPYRSHKTENPSLLGGDRHRALLAFCRGEDVSAFTYWHAPHSGGARRIADRAEIDWSALRDESGSYPFERAS